MSKDEPKMSDAEKNMRAHVDLQTLIEGEKIRKDPERHKHAMKKHKELQSALNAVAGGKPAPKDSRPAKSGGENPSEFVGGAQ